jgi:hypothetical protein
MITGPVRWYRDQPLYHSAMSRSSELAAASVVASAKNMTTTQRPPGRLLRVIGRHGPIAAKFAFSPRSGHGAALLVSAHETHEAYCGPKDHTRLVLPRLRLTPLVSKFEIEGHRSRKNVGGNVGEAHFAQRVTIWR